MEPASHKRELFARTAIIGRRMAPMKMLLTLLVVGLGFGAGMVFQGSKAKPTAREPARVIGIGGIFFKSENPSKLTSWYEKHLGIKLREGAQPGEPPMFEWREKDR